MVKMHLFRKIAIFEKLPFYEGLIGAKKDAYKPGNAGKLTKKQKKRLSPCIKIFCFDFFMFFVFFKSRKNPYFFSQKTVKNREKMAKIVKIAVIEGIFKKLKNKKTPPNPFSLWQIQKNRKF